MVAWIMCCRDPGTNNFNANRFNGEPTYWLWQCNNRRSFMKDNCSRQRRRRTRLHDAHPAIRLQTAHSQEGQPRHQRKKSSFIFLRGGK